MIVVSCDVKKPESDNIAAGAADTQQDEIQTLIAQNKTYAYKGQYDSAYHTISQAYQLVKQMDDPRLEFHVLLELGKTEFSMEILDSVRSRIPSLLAYCENKEPDSMCARLYNFLGRVSDFSGFFQESKKHFETAYEIFEALGDKKGAMEMTQNLAVVNHNNGYSDEALKQYLETLAYFEENNITKNLPTILNNIALLLIEMNEPDKGLPFLNKAIQLSDSLNSPFDLYSAYLHKAIAYQDMEDLGQAIKFLDTAEVFLPQPRPPSRMARIYNMRGAIELERGNTNEAEHSFLQCISLSKEAGIPVGMAHGYNGLGNTYLETHQYTKAEWAYQQAILVFPEAGEDHNLLMVAYGGISDALEGQSDFEGALDYLTRYLFLRESIYTEEKSKALTELRIRYETAQVEKENVLLKQSSEMQDELLRMRESTIKRQNIAVILISFITVGLFILLVLFVRERHRLKRLLDLLHHQNAEITAQQEVMKELINTRDRFFSIIAHDLKTPFNGLLGLSEFMIAEYDRFSEEERRQNIQHIHDASLSTFLLLENLLTWARSQRGELQPNHTCFNLGDGVERVVNLYEPRASAKEIRILTDIPSDLAVFADESMIQSVIRNLLNNAIKFSPRNSNIRISAKAIKNKIHIRIRDEGIGMSEDELAMLFRIDKKFSNPGTEKEAGTGLGLIMCKDFIDRNNGSITITSQPGQGTEVIVEFPAC